jgi:replicative DNA helicase
MEDFDYLAFKTFKELGKEFKEGINSISTYSSNNSLLSGFDRLDAVIGVFQTSNLILIGGVEGMGKTSFVTSLISKMAIEKKYSIVFFSLQLTSEQFMSTLVSQQTGIPLEKFRFDSLCFEDANRISKKIKEIENSQLNIYDYPFLTVSDIEEALGFYPPDFLQCIVIDSLQLVAKGKNDKAGKVLNKSELSKITFQLKKIAKKLNITIIITTNLELTRKTYYLRPLLSDIRKQAPIDTFADMVLLLYRPEYYKIEEWDDEDCSPTNGEAEINIVKNTNGRTGQVRIKFDGKFSFFDNLTT